MPVTISRVGHAGWGDNDHFGLSVARDLSARASLAGLMALAVSGRLPSVADCAVLDDLAAAMTVVDPRIWPFKLTRLVSSAGRCLPGLAAACVSLEDARVGHWTSGAAAALLLEVRTRLGRPATDGVLEDALAELCGERGRLVGFGVPFRDEDERVVVLRRCLARRGRHRRPFWRLFERMGEAMARIRPGVAPNIGLAVGAVGLDLGFSPAEIARLSVVFGLNAYIANAVEAAEQQSSLMLVLPAGAVRYAGAPPRVSPRALTPLRPRRAAGARTA
jgi:hypothetical protein